MAAPTLHQEDVTKIIINAIKTEGDPTSPSYGYDVYLPNIIRNWATRNTQQLGIQIHEADRYVYELSPKFFDAAWELCRRGILRPGVTRFGEQVTDDGSGGGGFTITTIGREWLRSAGEHTVIPTEPARFSAIIKPYSDIFGPGFEERAIQGVLCYNATAYLACCVMCGAASESVLLYLAIEKTGNEADVLKQYASANGTKKLQDIILSQLKGNLEEKLSVSLSNIQYWRNEAGHGEKSDISEQEAYTSLNLLLRLAQLVQDNYSELVKS